MADERRDDGPQRGNPEHEPDPLGASPSRRGAGVVLYVHQQPDGVRALTGGGTTADWMCVDIFGTVSPGGTWNDLRYEDLAPGRYDIVDGQFVREDGTLIPVSS